MKGFVKYLLDNKGKIGILLFVNLVIFLIWYNLIKDAGDMSKVVEIIILAATVILNLICFWQAWREYKGYEGFWGKK
jgi:hypothetical protein